MFVVIVFPNGAERFRASWIFRQLVEDVSESFSSDAEVKHEMGKRKETPAWRTISLRWKRRLRQMTEALGQSSFDAERINWIQVGGLACGSVSE